MSQSGTVQPEVNRPKVSIVVPVFRGMPHLPALIKSITQQTYQNLELIATVTPTGDGSEELLDQAGFTVEITPPGTGAAQNWTRATELATGEFTKLICQDDLLYPDAISQQVADLNKHSSAQMAIAKRDIVNSAGKTIFTGRGLQRIKPQTTTLSGTDLLRLTYLHGGNIFGEPLVVLFRTKALQSVMPWRDDNPLMLDLNTYSRVAPLGDIAIRHDSIGSFRVSSSSWSTNLAKVQLEQTRTWQKEYEAQYHPSKSDQVKAAVGRHLQTNTRRAAYSYLKLRGDLT